MFMLLLIFVIACGLFEWKGICPGFYGLFIYGLPLEEVQPLREEGRNPINRFNTATCLCLSQARNWISNFIYMSWVFFSVPGRLIQSLEH